MDDYYISCAINRLDDSIRSLGYRLDDSSATSSELKSDLVDLKHQIVSLTTALNVNIQSIHEQNLASAYLASLIEGKTITIGRMAYLQQQEEQKAQIKKAI